METLTNRLRFVERKTQDKGKNIRVLRILQQCWIANDGQETWRDVPVEVETT